jgi:hypothetical protein
VASLDRIGWVGAPVNGGGWLPAGRSRVRLGGEASKRKGWVRFVLFSLSHRLLQSGFTSLGWV